MESLKNSVEGFKNSTANCNNEILKVSSKSKPNSVAGAIAGVIRKENIVELQAVGAGAINQAVKSVAIARGYLAPTGINISCAPAFMNITIGEDSRTAMKFIVTLV